MKSVQKANRFGGISIAMIPISIIGTFAFSLIFLSAPIGIVAGIMAVRRGNKTLGMIGAIVNALLLLGLLTLWIWVGTSKND